MTVTSGLDVGDRRGASRVLRSLATLGTWLALPVRAASVRVRNPLWPVTRSVMIGALAAAAVILAMMFLVDAWAINAARHLPERLVQTFDFLTDFGKAGWLLLPLAGLLVALAFVATSVSRLTYLRLTGLALRLWFLFLAIAIPGLVTDVLKLVGRARPFVTGTADPFAYSFLDGRSDYASLPSGHATTAFAAAVAFGALWPRMRPVWWIYAVIIALSRVVTTAHHPSDVVAGAIVGILGAILIRNWFAQRRLVFRVDGENEVRARRLALRRRLFASRPTQERSRP